MAAMEAKTASLDKVVGFHAWSNSNPLSVGAHSTIILNRADVNIGNAYDTLTGVFTAPVPGLYNFHASTMDYHRNSSNYLRATMQVDSKIVAITISDSRQGLFDHGSMNAIVHLQAGQRVLLRNPDGVAHDYYDSSTLPYTTFSGFLIRAD